MKALSVVVAALCVSAVLSVDPDCIRIISDPATNAVTRYNDCKHQALDLPDSESSQCDEFPSVLPTTTSDPLFLVVNALGTPSENSEETGYFDDHVEIYFKESAKYYGKAGEGPVNQPDAPKVAFAQSNPANLAAADSVFDAYSVKGNLNTFDSQYGCAWTHHFSLNWNKFLSAYSATAGVFTQASAGEYVRSLANEDGIDIIRYDVDFNVYNYEWVVQTRPGGADISVERVIRHALPFSIKFKTQATITSVSAQVYSTITSLAAIVSQSVTLIDFNGHANANIMLYTSVQWPFVIDELRIDGSSVSANIQGTSPSDVGQHPFVGSSQFLNAYAFDNLGGQYGTTGTTQATGTGGPTGVSAGQANTNADVPAGEESSAETFGSTCRPNGLCTQVWPLGLSTYTSGACSFTGTYNVLFTLKCHPDFAGACPINRDAAHSFQRIIPGSTGTAVTGTNANFFLLNIASSSHCTQVVDTIGLNAKLTTHGSPLDVTDAEALAAFNAKGTDYKTTDAGVPQPNYDYAPVPQANDPDNVAWGPAGNAAELAFDVETDSQNGKTAFLNGQWVFGVALVKVQQATVVRAAFDSLTISGFGGDFNERQVVNAGSIQDSDTLDALHLAFVDDTTSVNVNTPGHRIAYPYFFFKVDQTAFNIASDSNKPITFSGTIKVTYQNAASVSDEQLEKTVPFSYTIQANTKTQGTAVSASIGIGNGATGSASTANSTFLGVSSSTAAGVALAVGVLVGLLVGLLVSVARRRPAPTKAESQVQLTNSASTSAV